MLALHDVALYRARLLCRMVEVKGALCLNVVVAPVAQRVVGADQDLGAAAGELCGRKLRLVVLLVCRGELGFYVAIAEDRLDCLCDIRELWVVLALRYEGGVLRGAYLSRRCRLYERAKSCCSRHCAAVWRVDDGF